MRTGQLEFPKEQDEALKKARRLEWITLAYLATAITAVAVTMGSSQAMKAVAFEDALSFVPPISFLIATKLAIKGTDPRHPYGKHRVVGISYLAGALALLAFGSWLLVDGVEKLVSGSHPSIGTVRLFGQTVWLGWPMMAAAIYSAVPAVILGRMKVPLARTLHDKGLHADGRMNKADWKSGMAASLGILGIALGFWWADALAGALIALDITWDGVKNTRIAVEDLMDREPTLVGDNEHDPIVQGVEDHLKATFPWIADTRARLREEGHVLFGEVLVVPHPTDDLLARVEEAREAVRKLHWRLFDVVVVPVYEIPREDQD